jgi:solute carrier family 29 (equilibrative nucleoside transporter) protein 4
LISFSDGFYRRLFVCAKIWPYMVGILLNYMVTLSLFPGIESEIQSCWLGDWMPVILMATFNISDLIGKVKQHFTLPHFFTLSIYFQMVAGLEHSWSRGELVLWPLSRLIILPLIVMCAAPHHAPIFPGEMLPISFIAILGLTNGLFISLPIILLFSGSCWS